MAEAGTFGLPSVKVSGDVQDPAMRDALVNVANQVQFWLRQIVNHMDEQRGNRGTPSFAANVQMQSNRICGLGTPVLSDDAQTFGNSLSRSGEVFDAQNRAIINLPEGVGPADAINFDQLRVQLESTLIASGSTNAPPEVEDANAIGSVITRFAREDHTHSGVNPSDVQTVGGAKTWSAAATFSSTIAANGNLTMGGDALIARDVNAGLTASTTQTQGQGALTAEVNEVSTVANANDTITLPTALAGLKIIVINNGANTLQIFPATSDDLGAGVNTATTLAAASNVVFIAYDATNWEII